MPSPGVKCVGDSVGVARCPEEPIRRRRERKLEQALKRAGPSTCKYIRQELDGERFCSKCPHWGEVKSPIVLGRDHGGKPDGRIELRVHPAMVPANWMLADVAGAKNALYVHSYALGPSMYYGASPHISM